MERKGDWLELRLPKSQRAATTEATATTDLQLREYTGIPEGYWRRMSSRNDIAQIGDRLRLRFFPERELGFEPAWIPIDILYEDDFCLVVDKPAGMPIHPSVPGELPQTLANAVAFHYASTGQQVAVRHIHRLDVWTSGPVLYAKNEFAQYMLDAAMREKKIERIYTAIVQGLPQPAAGTIDAPIGRDRHRSGLHCISAKGDKAITHYKTIEQYPASAAARLALQLETGRTHQIRVHLRSIGHPIIGDEMYGKKDIRINRQALHGQQLRFRHPFTGEAIQVESPLPEDMRVLIHALEV